MASQFLPLRFLMIAAAALFLTPALSFAQGGDGGGDGGGGCCFMVFREGIVVVGGGGVL